MKPHGNNPENESESDNSQKINIKWQVVTMPGSISGNIGKVGKG